MHARAIAAQRALSHGASLNEVAVKLGVSRETIRLWSVSTKGAELE